MKMEVRIWTWHPPCWWAVPLLVAMLLKPATTFCPPLCSCDDSTLLTDCHDARNLKMVPIFLNPQTKFLSLRENQIKEISMSLTFYSELQLLDFSQNQIESLGGNNFENLRNLKVLNVSYNSIRSLDSGAFSGLSHMLVLDLSVNQIDHVDPNSFRGLSSLRELSLDRNRLETLDWDWFSELKSLERLSLRFNFIRTLQPPLSFGLSTIVDDNSNQSEKLSPLPPQIPWTLGRIQELDLSWNQLAVVRNFGLAPLLNSLRTLNLCCNYIHTLELHAFSTFTTNNFSQVLLTSALMSVNLSQNRLTALPAEALAVIGPSLAELDLSANRITDELSSRALSSLKHLQTLRISENPGIFRMDPHFLADNTELIRIEANQLNLTELPLGILDNKPELERFSLQFSQIRTFPSALFSPPYVALLNKLDLFGNPVECNCSLWNLYEHVILAEGRQLEPYAASQADLIHERLQSGEPVPLGSIQCATPAHLQEFRIRELSRSDFEHCFEPMAQAPEYFELLVILLATGIVVLILVAVGIKLCCVYHVCPHREKRLDLDDGKKEGTTLDEFCSTLACESASVSTSCLSNGKLEGHRDFTPPIPPSPVVSRSKVKTGTLPNGGGLYIGNGHVPVSYHRSPRTGTLGQRVPIPYNYDDEDDRYHQYMTINPSKPCPGTVNSNKLRFNPNMQLILDNDRDRGQPPGMILHYECDYRRGNQPGQRYKQVPSVLV